MKKIIVNYPEYLDLINKSKELEEAKIKIAELEKKLANPVVAIEYITDNVLYDKESVAHLQKFIENRYTYNRDARDIAFSVSREVCNNRLFVKRDVEKKLIDKEIFKKEYFDKMDESIKDIYTKSEELVKSIKSKNSRISKLETNVISINNKLEESNNKLNTYIELNKDVSDRFSKIVESNKILENKIESINKILNKDYGLFFNNRDKIRDIECILNLK